MSKIPVRGRVGRPSGLPRLALTPQQQCQAIRRFSPSAVAPQQKPSASASSPEEGLTGEESMVPQRQLNPGDAVRVDGEPGVVRFVGATRFSSGVWCGVELQRPIGKNDGSVSGRRYFTCRRQFGLFAPLGKVVCEDVFASRDRKGKTTPLSSPLDVPAVCAEVDNGQVRIEDPGGGEAASPSSFFPVMVPQCSPAADLWWDSDGDALDSVEHLEDIEMDESSLGILTPDQMNDGQLLMKSFDLAGGFDETIQDMDATVIAADCESLVRLTADDGQPIDVLVRLDGDPDWEDEFNSRESSVQDLQTGVEGGGEEVCEVPLSPAGEVQVVPSVSVELQIACSSTLLGDHSTVSMDIGSDFTASVSSESSDVTVKDEPRLDLGRSQSEHIERSEHADEASGKPSVSFSTMPDVGQWKQAYLDETAPHELVECSEGVRGASVERPEMNPPTSSTTICSTASSCSIDGGYQGDAEFDTGSPNEDPSRPPPRLETLTDSDFCSEGAGGTESEAEHRLTDVEMESSGVYSDVESRRSAEPIGVIDESEENAVLSPVKETAEEDPSSESVGTPSSVVTPTEPTIVPVLSSPMVVDCEDEVVQDPVATTSPVPARRDPSAAEKPVAASPSTSTTSHRKEPLKMNHPLPRRNVQSKLRSLLDAVPSSSSATSPQPENGQQRRPPRAPRKGRWDAVMSRIEKGREDQKTRPKRDVKSRLMEGVGGSATKQQAATANRKNSAGGRSSRTDSTQTLTGSRSSLRHATAVSDSRSGSPTFSELSSGSSQSERSLNSRGSMNSRTSASKPARKPHAGSSSSLVNARSLIPTSRFAGPGSSSRNNNNVGKPSVSGHHRPGQLVPKSATRAAPLEPGSRRHAPSAAPSAHNPGKPDIATISAAKPSRSSTRAVATTRSQGKTPAKTSSVKDGRSAGGLRVVPTAASPAVSAAPSGPPAAARLQQLEGQLCSRQRQLRSAGDDLRHATRCFDAAMVMVNYLSNECNPFGLQKELHALQSRATSLQLALDEAAAGQGRLQTAAAAAASEQLRRDQLHSEQLSELSATAENQLQEERGRSLSERQQLESRHAAEQLKLSEEHAQLVAEQREEWERQLQAAVDESRQLAEERELLAARGRRLEAALSGEGGGRVQMLEQEVCSLQAVLELRRDEIAELRRHREELHELRELRPRLEERVQHYRARAEDLHAQLTHRTQAERELADQNKKLRDYHDRETKVNRRLSMENEQLQYKLRTQLDSPAMLSRSMSFRSPRTAVYTRSMSETPHRAGHAGARSPLKSSTSSVASACNNSTGSLGRIRGGADGDRVQSVSPPASPHVRGVVQKSDSISWVLELETSGVDGETSGGDVETDSDEPADSNGVMYEVMGGSAPASLHSALLAVNGEPAGAAVMRDIPEAMELESNT